MTHPPTIADDLARRSDNFLLLRIIAAVAVIYGHSFALAVPDGSRDIFLRMNWGYYSGDLAVFAFFVISGFMVTGSYVNRHNLFEFSLARFLRIVPAYAAVLLLSVLVIGPLFTRADAAAYWSSPSLIEYVVKNLKFGSDLAWRLPGLFDTHPTYAEVNGSIWTLPAEVRMYMLVAILGGLGLLRSRLPAAFAVIALLALGIFAAQYLPLHKDWVRLAGYFCLGMLAQLYRDRIRISHAGMAVLVVAAHACSKSPGYPQVFAVALAYFCFWFAYRTPVFARLEKWGDPSYGIYLWGWPVQQCLVELMPAMRPWQNFALAAPIAIVLGYASWHVVEKNALRLKNLDFGRMKSRTRGAKA